MSNRNLFGSACSACSAVNCAARSKFIICISVLALTLATKAALAQPDQPGPLLRLTLEEAVDRGLRTSARLREAEARFETASATADERRAQTLPQVSLQAGYTRTNHVTEFTVPTPGSTAPRVLYPDIPDNYRSRLDLQFSLFDSGRLEALQRSARSESEAVAAEQRVVATDLTLEVARAYWTLVAASEQLRVVEESLVRTRTHLNDARQRLDAGLIAPHEVLAVEVQQSRQELLALQAAGNRDIAQADLGRLIGAPRVRIEPATALAAPPRPTDAVDALLKLAATRRGEREALELRVSAAEARQQAAQAGSRPTVGAAGGFDYARPNPRIFPREGTWQTSWDASVNVSWPLFDGGRSRAEAAGASAATRAMRARLEEFDSVLDVEVRQRLTGLATATAAIQTAEQGVRAAAEARRVAGERFLAGVATSADVLDAQIALLQAGLDHTQALASARIAEARLARTTGGGLQP
jgi:outer membrane protein TolC